MLLPGCTNYEQKDIHINPKHQEVNYIHAKEMNTLKLITKLNSEINIIGKYPEVRLGSSNHLHPSL